VCAPMRPNAGPGADVLTKTPHQGGEEIEEKVDAKFKDAGLAATLTGGGVPYTVPMDSEIMTELLRGLSGYVISIKPCLSNSFRTELVKCSRSFNPLAVEICRAAHPTSRVFVAR
jgi:hypothetical protein